MPWQDWIFTIGQLIFVLALIPSIRGKEKPAFSTSLITSIFLLSFAYTYMTLNLMGSAFFALLSSSAWGILAFQKFNSKR